MASAILYNGRNDQNPNFTPNFTHFNHISRQPHHFPATEKPGTQIFRQPHHPPAPEKPFIRRTTKPNGYSYITFRLSTFSKRELKDLKKRLVSDLHRVRVLRQRIHHDLTGPKRPSPSPLPLVKETTKKQKTNVKNTNAVKKGGKKGRKNDSGMKNCMQILGKLMVHKNGWVFNKPVDPIGMKLYDYNDVIKKPMDLGTIKRKIERNVYNGDCFEFANDVRLTFKNAMVYNGKGSDVYDMAERLLMMFEGLFSANVKVGKKTRSGKVTSEVEKAVEVVRNVVERTKRREMTAEEKQKLAESLFGLNLGKDGTDELVRILKGRASGLSRFGEDEIEIDIGVIDNETLWELRSFIDGKKEMECFLQADDCIVSEPNGVIEEEEVDIGEEIQLTNYTSVEIEKDSGSSSSDSDSSSGSSSSDCSSGSGYNQQEANSTPIMGN